MATTVPTGSSLFGSSIKRREDPRFITGRGLYTDDVKLPGTTHAAFVRSPYAHARHNDIDDGRSAAPIAGAMRSHGVAPNARLAAGPAVPSKCR